MVWTVKGQRVSVILNDKPDSMDAINARRRGSVLFSVGDFVLMRRDSEMYKSRKDHEFLGPYEVVRCLDRGR